MFVGKKTCLRFINVIDMTLLTGIIGKLCFLGDTVPRPQFMPVLSAHIVDLKHILSRDESLPCKYCRRRQ